MGSWLIEATDSKGQTTKAVTETYDLQTEHDALLWSAGFMRGMGFVVKDLKVKPTKGQHGDRDTTTHRAADPDRAE